MRWRPDGADRGLCAKKETPAAHQASPRCFPDAALLHANKGRTKIRWESSQSDDPASKACAWRRSEVRAGRTLDGIGCLDRFLMHSGYLDTTVKHEDYLPR